MYKRSHVFWKYLCPDKTQYAVLLSSCSSRWKDPDGDKNADVLTA